MFRRGRWPPPPPPFPSSLHYWKWYGTFLVWVLLGILGYFNAFWDLCLHPWNIQTHNYCRRLCIYSKWVKCELVWNPNKHLCPDFAWCDVSLANSIQRWKFIWRFCKFSSRKLYFSPFALNEMGSETSLSIRFYTFKKYVLKPYCLEIQLILCVWNPHYSGMPKSERPSVFRRSNNVRISDVQANLLA